MRFRCQTIEPEKQLTKRNYSSGEARKIAVNVTISSQSCEWLTHAIYFDGNLVVCVRDDDAVIYRACIIITVCVCLCTVYCVYLRITCLCLSKQIACLEFHFRSGFNWSNGLVTIWMIRWYVYMQRFTYNWQLLLLSRRRRHFSAFANCFDDTTNVPKLRDGLFFFALEHKTKRVCVRGWRQWV